MQRISTIWALFQCFCSWLNKKRVMKIETACRITGVDREEHLRASHCKPWRDANSAERLDGENGLLLTPSINHLFDRSFIAFEDNGQLLVSPVAHRDSLVHGCSSRAAAKKSLLFLQGSAAS